VNQAVEQAKLTVDPVAHPCSAIDRNGNDPLCSLGARSSSKVKAAVQGDILVQLEEEVSPSQFAILDADKADSQVSHARKEVEKEMAARSRRLDHEIEGMMDRMHQRRQRQERNIWLGASATKIDDAKHLSEEHAHMQQAKSKAAKLRGFEKHYEQDTTVDAAAVNKKVLKYLSKARTDDAQKEIQMKKEIKTVTKSSGITQRVRTQLRLKESKEVQMGANEAAAYHNTAKEDLSLTHEFSSAQNMNDHEAETRQQLEFKALNFEEGLMAARQKKVGKALGVPVAEAN